MNRSNRGANTNVVQMLTDMVLIYIVYLIERALFSKYIEKIAYLECLAPIIVFGVVYILSNKEARIYNVTLFFYLDRFWKILTKSWLLASITTIVIMYVYNAGPDVRKFHLYYLLMIYLAICLNMLVSRFVQMVTSNYQAPRTAYVGVFEEYEKFNYFLNKTSMRVENVGYILKSGVLKEKVFNVLGNLSELEGIIRNHELECIYFMQHSDDSLSNIQRYIDICLEMGVTVKVVMDVDNTRMINRSNSYVSSIGTYPMIIYHTVSLNAYEQFIKRISDILISLVGLIIASPVMLLTAIAIKIDSKGPVLFRQERVGQNGRTFSIYKFRSMCEDAEERRDELKDQNMMDGVMFKVKDDPRVTRVGKFIRRTSIDELPQFFNVLNGDMSIVGTRPPTVEEVSQYRRSQWRRISIKPGITGMWQVSGRSSITNFDKIVELDLKYIDNWTLLLDIQIIIKTIGVLIKRKGAY
ncbi:sugar transferase [Butyrivibrio sp. VCD2006]|uniref:sugar transferase n=1 Tax=Butyrivibrio sp. VCD2006 TaxID=1280664 RepID=UPI00041449C5|nr:sugar transferase [Butyrivibrio sp. VCD2006]